MGLRVSQLEDEWTGILSTFSSLPLLISFLIIITVTVFFYKSRNTQNLKQLPGPRGIPILGNLPFLEPDLHTHFARLAHTYGPIFKIHLGSKVAVVVTSPSLAKKVLKEQDTTFTNRDISQLGRTMSFGVSHIVWTPYGPEWRMLRKACVQEMVSKTSLNAVYWLRRREVGKMVREIHGKIGLPVINVREAMLSTAWNIVMNMLWGDGGDDERIRITGLVVELRQVVDEVKALLGKPNFSALYRALVWFDLLGI